MVKNLSENNRSQKEDFTMSAEGDLANARRIKWFSEDPPPIKPETREVFEKYSKIPPDNVVPHVYAIVRPIPFLIYLYIY